MMYAIRLLRRDERGASIVEMALAAPILGAFLVGMVDLSRAYSYKLQLEQAAQRSIEYVQRNGFTPGQEDTVKAEALSAAGTGSSATVNTWAECRTGSTVTTVVFTDPCTGADSYARYLSVDVQKVHTPFFRIKWNLRTASSNYTLHGKAAIRVQ